MQIRMLIVTLGISAVIAMMLATVTPTFAHIHGLSPANECAPGAEGADTPGRFNVGAGNESDPQNFGKGVGQDFIIGGMRGILIPEDNPSGNVLPASAFAGQNGPASDNCAEPLG